MAPQITLHHLTTSRSERIFWLLEELGLPYNVKIYFRLPTRSAPPELKQVSPYGKAPVVEIDGEVISESGYIVHRLLAIGGGDVEKVPSNDSIFWSHFSEGSQMNLLQAGAIVAATGAGFVSGQIGDLDEGGKAGVRKYTGFVTEQYLKPQNQNILDQIEDFLAKRPGKYFSGTDKPGQGDFMMFFAFNSLLTGSRKDAGFNIGPASRKWYEMVTARPALKKGMERLQKEEEAAKAKI